MAYVFGIDLGTTYSCIAYVDEYGKPVVLKNSDGEYTTPSVVMLKTDGNVIVGTEAKRSIEIEPDKGVQFIKRKMGRDNDKITLNGKTYSAPEISAYILKKLVADANEELIQRGVIKRGEEIKDVVITCPAYFGMNEKVATKTAGEIAGLNVLNIITEPTAAAISYGMATGGKKETVLVYDLGGGTFDITVVNISGSNISIVCTGGDDLLGGKDWDEALMNYLMERYEEEYEEDLSEAPEIVATLYLDVEIWKKALTARKSVTISVNGPAGRLREELTREKYEEITNHLLDRTKNLLDGVLNTASKLGYPLNKIKKVLLVGGSSKMPQIAAMIERDYHIVPSLQDPDEAVAKGASIFAQNERQFLNFALEEARKSGLSVAELVATNLQSGNLDRMYLKAPRKSLSEIKVNVANVLSRTYGMTALVGPKQERKIINMLMINDKLPATKTIHLYTEPGEWMGTDIEIYESRSTEKYLEIEGRKPLTTIHMSFKQNVPTGTAFDVTFSLDNAGILHVTAEEELYHSQLDTTYTLSNQLSAGEKEIISKRLKNAIIK